MPQLRGDLVVLSDANTDLDPAAVRRLARWFADPTVGAACGRLILKDGPTGRNADGAYWAYETFLKTCEARLGALLGVNGAIYAIRRITFAAIPDDAIIDDFLIPLTAKLNTGCGIVYDRDAIAREETAPDVRGEFRRRCRIATGGFRALRPLRPLLDPRRGWIALSFFSHKVLRWFGPCFLLGALASAASLWRQPLYRAAAIAQLAFYAAALAATAWPRSLRMPRALRGIQMFAGMNVAIGVGGWRGLSRARTATWQPTDRSAVALRRAA
jgi:cellulose synthase/poly-beta-1,6-N-acetylglucosamine synthase-like glycosyltransferase